MTLPLSLPARVKFLKAMVPEFEKIARAEASLQRDLYNAHKKAAIGAVSAASKAAMAGTPTQVADKAGKAYNAVLVPAATKALEKTIPVFYRGGKVAAHNKAIGKYTRTLRYDFPPPPEEPFAKTVIFEKAPKPKSALAEIKPSFGVVDEEAIKKLIDHQVFWVGRHWEDNLSARIAEVSRDIIVNQGLSGAQAAKEIADAVARELDLVTGAPSRPPEYHVPAGYRGTAQSYYHNLSANSATTGRVFGSIQAFKDLRVSECEIVNPIDERTCERCIRMDGKVFKLSQAEAQMAKVLSAKSPTGIRGRKIGQGAQPWLGVKDFKSAVPTGKGPAYANSLASKGIVLPPYHFSCRCTCDISDSATVLGPE